MQIRCYGSIVSSDEGDPSPFDGIDFDDDWINYGPTEPSAEERALAARRARSAALRQRIQDAEQAEAALRTAESRHRRGSSGGRFRLWGLIALVVALATLAAIQLAPSNREDASNDIGSDSGLVQPGAEQPDSGGVRINPASDLPTPNGGTERLLNSPAIPTGSGGYAFSQMIDDVDQPMRFDPCRPHPIVINPANQPQGGEKLVEQAAVIIGGATGMVFTVEGTTDEPYAEDREMFQPDRYGDRWAPIVVWWETPQNASVLAGSVAGYAGPTGISISPNPLAPAGSTASGPALVTGQVLLDAPDLERILDRNEPEALAVVVHELAHVAGLDHTDDDTQLMYPEAVQTELGDGDRRGLRELGQGPCRPDL